MLSGENESRKSSNTGKIALFFKMQAFSDPVSMQSVVSISILHKKYTFSFQCTDSFYVGGQLEKAVVQLTYGDIMANTLLSGKSLKCDFKCGFLLASGTNLFHTSAGHSNSKIKAMCVLRLHLLVLLLQKHSYGNIVGNFSCNDNINTTTCIVHGYNS